MNIITAVILILAVLFSQHFKGQDGVLGAVNYLEKTLKRGQS